MNTDYHQTIISLIKSAIKSESVNPPDNINWGKVLGISENHQMTPIIYYGIHNSNINLSGDIKNKFKQSTYSSTALNEQQNYAISDLFKEFSYNNIDYMPLKGMLLKQLYPNPEMRVMSDIDILIKIEQYDIISKIMKNLGYNEITESDHEFVWRKPPMIVIELHKRLIPSYNKDYYAYFGDGWQLAERSEYEDNRYEMSAEDKLIYIFTHFAKHYRDGGIGIKHLIDIWVYKNNYQNLDERYIKEELTKLQLYEFYLNILTTIDVWFKGTPSNNITDLITYRIFDSGTYGTHENKVIASAIKDSKANDSAVKTRRKKIIKTIFLPYSSMCKRYTILKKIPLLLPIFWMVRIINVILFKRENIRRQKADMSIITNENIDKYHDELIHVGLDFNFKE